VDALIDFSLPVSVSTIIVDGSKESSFPCRWSGLTALIIFHPVGRHPAFQLFSRTGE
jgi:hypothetical protein